MTDVDGINNIELSLVDARTGIELRNIHVEFSGKLDLYSVLAKKINAGFLDETGAY
ncbi:hypothetical protein GCM10011613_27900 [Cellvibrio zantedeschiae]|uniref:Uncharacterized protein n=1 Tax=Cellvibrio zantedeschiae TaxID=1237077 RepID=A0ABQ3B6F8_9GAMM|nr:hypothetical protein [Cellvibrio zantedeschiae]GGY81651.1 hypothetical protein GCM10011613_27900 [Cellvibrio zantedeschiae]